LSASSCNIRQATFGVLYQQQVNALTLKPMVVIEPVRVDQRHIALPVLGDDFFGSRFGLVGQLGQIGSCLREWHDIAGCKTHDRLLEER
jgi:hypothetical protein